MTRNNLTGLSFLKRENGYNSSTMLALGRRSFYFDIRRAHATKLLRAGFTPMYFG